MRIRIIADRDPSSPREDSNLGIMVCDHRRYTLGDRKPTEEERDALRRGGWGLLSRYLRRYGGMVGDLIKLGLYDHSGISMYAGGGPHKFDGAGWDSGTVGWIYATKETVSEIGTPEDQIAAGLESEIKLYSQYLEGDVYGFVIERGRGELKLGGEILDSCWGFYGADPLKNGMLEHWDDKARAWWQKHGSRVEVEYGY
jgi:hypothetical protein